MPSPTDSRVGDQEIVDVAVVGAGFAGLAAALMLRRHRCSVLVFDGGPCRNNWAREVHGYLGVQGLGGADLRRVGSEQVLKVGGEIVSAEVAEAKKSGDLFVLTDREGRARHARRVLLSTGVRDIYPDIDNFFDFYGSSVHVCPHCDGFEWRDQPVAIISWSEATLPFALKITQWSPHLTVVTDGHSPELGADERAELQAHGIPVLTNTVRRFEGAAGQLEALRFEDGSRLEVRAAFFNIQTEFQNSLAQKLGCRSRPEGGVDSDDHQRTSVEGVWVAGDLSGEEQLVAVATAQGVRAAIDIYRSLPLPSGEPTPA